MKRIFRITAISVFLLLMAWTPLFAQCTVDGKWNTNWGEMNLTQSGASVTGTYTHDSGKINGSLNGSSFNGKWSEFPSYNEPGDAGDVSLEFKSDCASFSGNWRYGSTGNWSGGWTGTKITGTTTQSGEATQIFDTTDHYIGACGLTDTTTWKQTEDMNVSILQIWYTWETGETEVPFTFQKDGKALATGVFKKTNQCQWTWCNGNYEINKVFTKGSQYDLKLSVARQCKDDKGRGAVRLLGWKGSGSVNSSPTSSAYRNCTGTTTSLTLESRTVAKGRQVQIPFMTCNVSDLANMDLTITYDPAVMTFVDATKGSLNSSSLFENNETVKGKIKISFASTSGVSGNGSLSILTFTAKGNAGTSSNLTGEVTSARNSAGKTINTNITGGKFTVGSSVVGDCDGDNLVTSRDALAALQMSVGKIEADLCYDTNNDKKVDSSDARVILKKAVGGE